MIVIALTAFIGLILVAFFVAMFIRFGASASGREPLLPLSEEKPHVSGRKTPKT